MRLMHCPFCGEEERIRLFKHPLDAASTQWKSTQWKIIQYQVVCDACSASGPISESVTDQVAKNFAVANWNDRLSLADDTALRATFILSS